jgi:hypothetical protein
MKRTLLTLIALAAALSARAETPDSDIVDDTGSVVGHIHYHESPAPVHDMNYWIDYYSRIAKEAAAEARQNAPSLRAQRQRECRIEWYSLHAESRAAWEADVPGVKQAIRQGDYAGAMDLIDNSPQFKWLVAHQKQLLKKP